MVSCHISSRSLLLISAVTPSRYMLIIDSAFLIYSIQKTHTNQINEGKKETKQQIPCINQLFIRSSPVSAFSTEMRPSGLSAPSRSICPAISILVVHALVFRRIQRGPRLDPRDICRVMVALDTATAEPRRQERRMEMAISLGRRQRGISRERLRRRVIWHWRARHPLDAGNGTRQFGRVELGVRGRWFRW